MFLYNGCNGLLFNRILYCAEGSINTADHVYNYWISIKLFRFMFPLFLLSFFFFLSPSLFSPPSLLLSLPPSPLPVCLSVFFRQGLSALPPHTHHVDQTGLNVRDPIASSCKMLWPKAKVCSTTSGLFSFSKGHKFSGFRVPWIKAHTHLVVLNVLTSGSSPSHSLWASIQF